MKLRNILKDILSYGYSDIPSKSGRPAWLSFEDDFESKLFAEGFRKITLKESGLTTKDIDNRKTEIGHSDNFYIRNPKGGSKHPDFLVVENGKIFYIECKTAVKSRKPTWGSHFPRGQEIWIFCCGKRGKTFQINRTTIFLGEELIPPEDAKELSALQDKWLERDRKNHRMVLEKYRVGLDRRPQKFYDPEKAKTSVICHPERSNREARVLAFVAETLESEKVDKSPEMCYNIGKDHYFKY